MSAYNNKLLSPATEDDAQYICIKCSKHGCKVTVGQIYRLERNYNNPQLFVGGEIYIVDDEQKDNYSILMLCQTVLYK
ncbi:hypothetical protein NST99_26285 [Paenibacillus sp. FSL L8-0470]|uniref:hypothetical protein n=1 Tax=unclassified Paenibacillus TaxID=185978 RepID=UPI0030F7BFAB